MCRSSKPTANSAAPGRQRDERALAMREPGRGEPPHDERCDRVDERARRGRPSAKCSRIHDRADRECDESRDEDDESQRGPGHARETSCAARPTRARGRSRRPSRRTGPRGTGRTTRGRTRSNRVHPEKCAAPDTLSAVRRVMPRAVEERFDVAAGQVGDEAGADHEHADVGNLEEEHPERERGGEHGRAGVGVVAEGVEREADGGRGSPRASSCPGDPGSTGGRRSPGRLRE